MARPYREPQFIAPRAFVVFCLHVASRAVRPQAFGLQTVESRFMTIRLSVGDQAPDFTLNDQRETRVALADFADRNVLVYFYPRANTPGCTKQSCHLRDLLAEKSDVLGDTAIVGISPDVPAKQLTFDEKYSLGFPLLSDADHAIAEAYGVWQEKTSFGKTAFGIVRSAFLIGPDTTLRAVWYKISPDDTPTRLVAALQAERHVRHVPTNCDTREGARNV